MIIEGHDRLGRPFKLEATQVVIRDGFGNPVTVARSPDTQTFEVFTFDHPDFERVLKAWNIAGTILVGTVGGKELQQPPGTLWTPP